MNVKQIDFAETMKTTVVTQENKVKFLGNGHNSMHARKMVMKTGKGPSLWERRQKQSKFSNEEAKFTSEEENN